MSQAAGPAGEGEPSPGPARLGGLDVLRGVAVLGILIPNIIAFGQPFEAGFSPNLFLGDPGPLADELWAAQFVLVDGKLRGLFEVLFGASMMLFVERSWARGQTRWVQARRLAILGAFGLFHGIFLWAGDILWSYAVVGLAVLALLHVSAWRLAAISVVTALGGALIYALMILPIEKLLAAPASAGGDALASEAAAMKADSLVEAAVIRSGDYAAFVARNADYVLSSPFFDAFYGAGESVPLMLLGAALYKAGLFSGAPIAQRLRRPALAALAAGLAMNAVIAARAYAGGLTFWGTSVAVAGWSPLPNALMTFALVVLAAPIAARAKCRVSRLLAGAGRTAFSNYIGTSALMLVIFHGFGLGLFGVFNRLELYALVVPVWALMVAWPQAWLARYRYGPLEWLWRCLTYGKWVRNRREGDAAMLPA